MAKKYIICLIACLSLTGCSSFKPKEVGLIDGRLRPCPAAPKCVSSYYKKGIHHIDPLVYLRSKEQSYAKIVSILESFENAQIKVKEPSYIYAQFQVTSIKWIDDVEFLFDDTNQIIHFSSSASAKIGFWDWGENKRRAKLIIKLYRKEE